LLVVKEKKSIYYFKNAFFYRDEGLSLSLQKGMKYFTWAERNPIGFLVAEK
jgi:hypothetical protein